MDSDLGGPSLDEDMEEGDNDDEFESEVLLVERIFIELMTSGRRLKASERARNEGSTGPKRLDDTQWSTHWRKNPTPIWSTSELLTC
jgi:hypothetical protein